MPTKKKTAVPKAKKKAAVKKTLPKKVVAEPAVPAQKPIAPAEKFMPVTMSLHTNGGESTLTFSDEAGFKAAMQCIESAPREPTGARSAPTYTVTSDKGSLSFQIMKKYSIKS
tara:strand:- start:4518 stop:4856 length:339 start_codon:yes stop_codon:yes gene_type:complete